MNIDIADKDNELAVTEYVDDIYAFYKLSEVMFYALLCFVLCSFFIYMFLVSFFFVAIL